VNRRRAVVALVALAAAPRGTAAAGPAGAKAATEAPPVRPPGPRDLCPVCGMLVAKYPAWIAIVRLRDGGHRYFDGPKDLFKWLLDLPRYAPGVRRDDVAEILVTEFYGLKLVDARGAHYVIGSDVLGPMGHELVPLADAAEAAEFMRDHRGKRVLRFDEVTRELTERLDRGRFD
jgi:nitrous oxide reductase accessory protein NosL